LKKPEGLFHVDKFLKEERDGDKKSSESGFDFSFRKEI